MIEKFCKGCEKTFTISEYGVNRATKDGLQRKCKKCINVVVQNRYTLSCEQCGSSFSSHSKKIRFCGNQCAGASRRNRMQASCAHCGESIIAIESRVRRSENLFCNNKCYGKYKSNMLSGDASPIYTRVKKNCLFCSCEMTVKKSRFSRTSYCSKECYSSDQSKRMSGEKHPNYKKIECSCATCGARFYRAPSAIKTENLFCGKNCLGIHVSHLFSGQNHPQYKHGISDDARKKRQDREGIPSWRKKVFSRDRYTCQCCGQVGYDLNAHHIYNYADHPLRRVDVGNGITLCKECHSEFHSRYGRKNTNQKQLNEFISCFNA